MYNILNGALAFLFLHDSDGRALQANKAGPNWLNPSSPFLLMSTGNTKAPYHLDRLRKNANPPLQWVEMNLLFHVGHQQKVGSVGPE